MKISSKLSELKSTDLNCNVFDVYSYDGLSMQELLCQFFTKINECIKVSNETIDLASWLVNEGLKIEVVNKLMIWLEDGTLEHIINVNLFNTLHSKIENINSQLNQINRKLSVSVTDFGAKGDGITDDTEAFKKANDYLYNLPIITDDIYPQYRGVEKRTLIIPEGVYLVKGSDILGFSNRVEPNNREIILELKGNGSIIWDVKHETDVFCNLNHTFQKIDCYDINIIATSSRISSGGTVFKMYSDDKSKVTRSLFYNMNIMGGYNNNTPFENKIVFRINKIFETTGYGMCDQTLISHCDFVRFNNVCDIQNSESVNWTFDHCGFVADKENAIYFNFGEMYSNFNVVNSTFGLLQNNETILKNRRSSENKSEFYFSLNNNRIEFQYNGVSPKMTICDMQYGRLIMNNTNTTLSMNSVVSQEVKCDMLSSAYFDNVIFSRLNLYATNVIEGYNDDSIVLKDCKCSTYNLYSISNGVETTRITNIMGKDVRGIRFENFNDELVKNISFTVSNNLGSSNKRSIRKYNYTLSENGSSLNKIFYLPRFVNITKINVSNFSGVSDFRYIKITLGNNDVISTKLCGLASPSSNKKFTIFEGCMSVISSVSKDNHVIKFECVNDSQQVSNACKCDIEIEYEELNTTLFTTSPTSEGSYIIQYKDMSHGGTTEERTPSPYIGYTYYNTSTGRLEVYTGSGWINT